MPLLKGHQFITDVWAQVEDDQDLPDAQNITVSFARLQKDWDVLARFPGVLGVRVTNTLRSSELTPYIAHIALVVLAFPAFSDGRSYSLARQLRLDGYAGELRATGNILPDQLQYMLQIGIDTFAVSDRFSLDTWSKASRQMSLAYQRGLFRPAGEREVWSERHRGFEAWEEQPHAG
jgi:uncharacterized protein (DUF934 family)